MHTRVLTVRRAATALACAAAMVSLAACKSDTGAAGSAGGSTPSKTAEASPAAEPNGIEKLSAKAIYDSGHKANAAAGSFREQMTRGDTKTDMLLSATECVGKVKMAKGAFQVIRKGNDVWAKPDSAIVKEFNSELGANTLSADKWLHGTPSNPLMKGFASWCHQEQFTAPDTLDAGNKVTKGKVTTVDGRQAVPVVMTAKGESVTWYVATTGKPYYFKQVSSREDMQNLVYSDFGKPVGAQAPSGSVEEAPKK
ncbi:hypothetical protein ACFY1U_46105 [Streptomyces sp. NPDC001351]|uniref:hypothetical protein n=1 Tax=Streptomyces sp. NPDC001351 TaxID=3364564 RepID=UPI00367E0AF7